MAAHAFAIANNDIVHIGWSFDQKIADCIGFSIWRLPASGPGSGGVPLTSLPTSVQLPTLLAPPASLITSPSVEPS